MLTASLALALALVPADKPVAPAVPAQAKKANAQAQKLVQQLQVQVAAQKAKAKPAVRPARAVPVAMQAVAQRRIKEIYYPPTPTPTVSEEKTGKEYRIRFGATKLNAGGAGDEAVLKTAKVATTDSALLN